MFRRLPVVILCGLVLGLVVWLSRASTQPAADEWVEVAPGVLQTPGWPKGYALIADNALLLIDAPPGCLPLPAGRKAEQVVLTHYHRESVAWTGQFLAGDVPVKAPKAATEWLKTDKVRKFWKDSLPLRNSRTAYFVHESGFDGIDFSLAGDQTITWRGWDLRVIDTQGHARAHIAIVAQKKNGPKIAFVGGAFATPGKLWAPYTTDWDHWTDAGLVPTAKSLRRLAELAPDILCPAHGDVIRKEVGAALTLTATAVEEAGFMKSFERFTKDRLKNPPSYSFIVPKEQPMSNGSKPWARVSDHLWITGNTYVLKSKDNACLMFDPWDQRSADQFAKLQKDANLGPIEVVMFSHAHYDHYDGIYYLPHRDRLQVWALDVVAKPIADPFVLRAPFLDARPVKIDKKPRDGDTLDWREYRFRFHHLPGQTEFTMGVETTIDGKKCFFTADNFFHQDMFSGSGGWMGLNRSFPPLYGASAQKVLDARPDWVLAEHGGPYEFNAEDFRRRVAWAGAATAACDALSPSGTHLHDWNPHGVRVEPLIHTAKVGDKVEWTVVIHNVLPQPRKYRVTYPDIGFDPWEVEVAAGKMATKTWSMRLGGGVTPGRHIHPLRVESQGRLDPSDAILVIDVKE